MNISRTIIIYISLVFSRTPNSDLYPIHHHTTLTRLWQQMSRTLKQVETTIGTNIRIPTAILSKCKTTDKGEKGVKCRRMLPAWQLIRRCPFALSPVFCYNLSIL